MSEGLILIGFAFIFVAILHAWPLLEGKLPDKAHIWMLIVVAITTGCIAHTSHSADNRGGSLLYSIAAGLYGLILLSIAAIRVGQMIGQGMTEQISERLSMDEL